MPLTKIQSLGITDGTIVNADINASAAIAGTKLGAGAVLQVVNATYSTQTTSSSSTYADTGLTASITPTSASSKILILVSQNGVAKINDTAISLKLLRNSTDLITPAVYGAYTATSLYVDISTIGFGYLDSPSTTSSTTYKTQFKSLSNIATVYVQNNSATSTINLIEIAG
jgi:hypothetical protein